MKDQNKTKAQLINELEKLRLLTSELKTSEAEHKQTVEELKESEEKFRSFVETSDDLVFLLNKTGHIKYISPRVKELYGYQPDELIGKHLKKTTPMSEVPKAIKVINEVMRGRSLKNFLINQKKKNGQIIPMEVNAVPLKKEGKIVGVLGIIRDISERVQAQEALAEKALMLDNILRSAADMAIATTDMDFRITYYNPLAEKFFGYTAEEAIGRTVQEMQS